MGIYTLLPEIVSMSVTAGLAILAVLLCRCLLRRGPKLFSYLLWSVVLFRLLCPVSVSSPFSALGLVRLPEASGKAAENASANPSGGERPEGITSQLAGENGTGAGYRDAENVLLSADKAGGENAAADSSTLAHPAPLYEEGLWMSGGAGAVNKSGLWLPQAGNPILPAVRTTGQSGNSDRADVPVWLKAAAWIWLAGIAGISACSMFSMLRLKRRLVGAVRAEGNIYQSDYIDSPFVVGVFRPRIYLPSSLCGKEREYIVLHERTHLRRGDHIFRLLAFAALTLHWFNPLVWLAFYLSGRDMEMACDETVMKRTSGDIRAEYSASLLGLATGRRMIPGIHLAFGEGEVGSRIRNVMQYKKPAAFWIVFAVLLFSGTVCAFGSDPAAQEGAAKKPGSEAGGAGSGEGSSGKNAGTGTKRYAHHPLPT
ncbi:MAG: M56 family metallopeptidase, partial [Lachnospiraceae bacterium]|nr:M56 family metallopeptidase [Lachnospiraceae bacterium]